MSRASSRRVAIESIKPRIVVGEIAVRPARSPRIVAIGASSTGGRADREARVGEAEAVDPADLGKQPDHLTEREQDADHQHGDDQRVQARIGHEGDHDLLVQHDHDQAAQDQEHHHPDQEDPG